MSLEEKALSIIDKIIYLNIASVTPSGDAWNTPVYTAHDDELNFYWASWRENQHSQNIRNNNQVFLTIYDSTAPEGTGEGVYFTATVSELSDTQEITEAAFFYYGRKHKDPRVAKEFQGEYPRRMYKATLKKGWINSDGSVNNSFVDTREPLDLTKLRALLAKTK